jgi:NAD/NADP transhydrogenase alpha subunit
MAARTAIQIGARVATRVGSRIAKHVVKHKIKKEVNKKRKRELDESEDELDLAAREIWDELIEREMEVLERELGGDSDDGGALLGREFSGGEELFLD